MDATAFIACPSSAAEEDTSCASSIVVAADSRSSVAACANSLLSICKRLRTKTLT